MRVVFAESAVMMQVGFQGGPGIDAGLKPAGVSGGWEGGGRVESGFSGVVRNRKNKDRGPPHHTGGQDGVFS